MAQNPWRAEPSDLAKCLAVLDRRREHLGSRLADTGRSGASRAHDEAEARALDLAGAALLRCYLEVVTGVRADDLVRALIATGPDAPTRSRAERFLAMLDG